MDAKPLDCARGRRQKWVATWAASVHGPYPAGNASAQPDLKFAFPDPAQGAVDQSFRLIVKPDLWGDRVRIRLANTFGTQSITFDQIYVGVAATGGNIVKGTNRAVAFNGQSSVSIAPGGSSYSDAIDLKLPAGALTEGRKLAVSFHVDRADRPDDMAREGAADVVSQRPSLGQPHEIRRRRGVPLYDDVLVFPRCGRRDGAGEHGRRVRVRRFDYRRNAVDLERRRSLARRVVAPASRRVWQPRIGGERRHRRQPHPDARKLSATAAVLGRTFSAAAARARSVRPVRTVGCCSAGRD